jgi:hypothetical protein
MTNDKVHKFQPFLYLEASAIKIYPLFLWKLAEVFLNRVLSPCTPQAVEMSFDTSQFEGKTAERNK